MNTNISSRKRPPAGSAVLYKYNRSRKPNAASSMPGYTLVAGTANTNIEVQAVAHDLHNRAVSKEPVSDPELISSEDLRKLSTDSFGCPCNPGKIFTTTQEARWPLV
eukprot:TRINITY_DN3437_c0_g1_i1.p1 TRINITY_DN3437_c0_g1~~TRINITY_DN3437_c0_g1_i1.p1  ORF type:complete len:107 (+),score=7.07 TRINITY_DN3437_c0_g1_i1:88-408(+)